MDIGLIQNNNRRPASIKIKMFIYLTIFIAFVLGVLWMFQVVWLDDIYQYIKLGQIKGATTLITKSIEVSSGSDEQHREAVQSMCDTVAVEREMCIVVYMFEERTDRYGNREVAPIVYSDSKGMFMCYLHESMGSIQSIYNNTVTSENMNYLGKISFFHSDNVVSSRIIYNADGEMFFVILNSTLTPVEATTNTITTQLVWITGILLVGALVVAVFISTKVTAPIVGMNESAKVLAKGNYDVTFRGGEFKEIAELGDTLNYAAKELSKVDGIQKELIANISHDLRTPLTMIAGYSEVMRDIPGEMTPENMQIIIDETNRLSSLVNDLLDVSRMNSEVQKLNLSQFSLTESVESTIKRYQKLTENDGYTIIFEQDDEVYVNADKTRILQVLYNLINNAVNYTGEDKTVTVRQIVNGEKVRIEIEDTGDGISEEMLPLIWERYFKVDKVHKRAMVGTGLGLSIVKKILVMHNAHFGVSSVIGKGSIFWFELDAK